MDASAIAAQAVLDVARGKVSERESCGTYQGDIVRWACERWGAPQGEPWCAAFVSTCYALAAAGSGGVPEFSHVGTLSCDTLRERCVAAGWLLPLDAQAAPGDIVFFVHDGVRGIAHVGLVEVSDADGTIGTIEGNVRSGDRFPSGEYQHCVGRRQYTPATDPHVAAFARPIRSAA